MRTIRSVAGKIGRFVYARPMRVAWPGGVVSFTFDDFPKSALTVGAGILERYGARGTYYAAMGLAGSDGMLGPMFDHNDILAAHRAGHELACHTYSHLDCRGAAKSRIRNEIERNAAEFSALLSGYLPTSFAYPYGSTSVMVKRAVRSQFRSCRGVRRGINYGIADRADLLARDVYAADFDAAELRQLIDRNRSVGGWLIFYTHDVVVSPSPYGCTPEQLEAVVDYAAGHTTILPVRDVIAKLTSIPITLYERRNSLFRFALTDEINNRNGLARAQPIPKDAHCYHSSDVNVPQGRPQAYAPQGA